MTTLQEQFEKDYSDKRVEIIVVADEKYKDNNFSNYDLDLREYKNLKALGIEWNKITSIKLSECGNLEVISLASNNLTSIDFLNTLPHPERLADLTIYNNNIEPTNIEIFSRFINLEGLRIGTAGGFLEEGKRNKFFGSFKSWKNLTKLKSICIEATDVNKGLEYLPESLAKSTAEYAKKGYVHIECSPCGTDAKCSAIQNELRPFNYDLLAWQLAHPELMIISRPELFTNSDSKEKWIEALKKKIGEAELLLSETNEPDKIKRIERLKQKQENLKEVFTPSVVRTTEKVEELKTEIREKYKQLEQQRKTNQTVYSSSNSLYGYEGIGLEEDYGTVSRIKDRIEELKEKLEQLELQNQVEQKPK